MEYKLWPKGIDDRPSIIMRGTTFYAWEMVRSDRTGGSLYQLIFKHEQLNNKIVFKVTHAVTWKTYDLPRCWIVHDDEYFRHWEDCWEHFFLWYIVSDKEQVIWSNWKTFRTSMKKKTDTVMPNKFKFTIWQTVRVVNAWETYSSYLRWSGTADKNHHEKMRMEWWKNNASPLNWNVWIIQKRWTLSKNWSTIIYWIRVGKNYYIIDEDWLDYTVDHWFRPNTKVIIAKLWWHCLKVWSVMHLVWVDWLVWYVNTYPEWHTYYEPKLSHAIELRKLEKYWENLKYKIWDYVIVDTDKWVFTKWSKIVVQDIDLSTNDGLIYRCWDWYKHRWYAANQLKNYSIPSYISRFKVWDKLQRKNPNWWIDKTEVTEVHDDWISIRHIWAVISFKHTCKDFLESQVIIDNEMPRTYFNISDLVCDSKNDKYTVHDIIDWWLKLRWTWANLCMKTTTNQEYLSSLKLVKRNFRKPKDVRSLQVWDKVIMSAKCVMESKSSRFIRKSGTVMKVWYTNFKWLVNYMVKWNGWWTHPYDITELVQVRYHVDKMERDRSGNPCRIDFRPDEPVLLWVDLAGPDADVGSVHIINPNNEKEVMNNKFEEIRNAKYFTDAKIKKIINAEDSLRETTQELIAVCEDINKVASVLAKDLTRLEAAKERMDTKAIDSILKELKPTLEYIDNYKKNTISKLAPVSKAVEARSMDEKFKR